MRYLVGIWDRISQYHFVNLTEAIYCAIVYKIHWNTFGDQKEAYTITLPKIPAQIIISSLSAHLTRLNSQNDTVKLDLSFQRDNVPSQASRFTKAWLSDQGIVGEYRPPQSLDLDLNSVVKKISGRVLVGYHLKFPVKKCTNYHLLLIEDLCTELRMDIMK